jgi:thioesterase domain-containing protein
MATKFEGPVLIQAAPQNSRRAPLFLIHDGSGTIFSYYLLESLGRAVYGIANPRAYDEAGWGGGLKEMATEYLGMIRSIQPSGKILLGGQ